MTDKTQIIIDAASAMFGRYGFSKTTMGDIAGEAGVSRQTVYNAFPGKEEILRAAVRKYGSKELSGVMAAWREEDSFVAKIDLFHELVPIKWFETMHASPAWADLMEGMHKAAKEEVDTLHGKWKSALTEVFDAETGGQARQGRSAADIVDFFYSASINAKYGAQDIDHLRRRLETVKAATLAIMA